MRAILFKVVEGPDGRSTNFKQGRVYGKKATWALALGKYFAERACGGVAARRTA
jgi:hypothetical protein